MKKINFKGNLIEYKQTHRALVDYEVMAGKDTVNTYRDSLMLMYCIVRAKAKIQAVKFDMDFEAFVDWLDANPEALIGFTAEAPEAKTAEPDPLQQKKS